MPISINVRDNGPLMVSGDLSELELTDGKGDQYDFKPHEIGGTPMVILCRCGASVNKPFCDGTHAKVGFKAAEAAVSKSG